MALPIPVSKTCTFAASGTYGHECGKPATVVVVMPSRLTHSGYWRTGRCAECLKIKGGDNAAVLSVEPIDSQENDWNGRYN